ncbi:MAG: trypsin-like peptidase domain-containing protein [Ruminococcus sp.]|nr:trypsin-like peptidase domain-containing protein [Ruminococcus sp.]
MKKILSIVISAVLLVLTLTATVSVETSAVNTSKSYKVYNATTGSYIKSYTLAPNAVEDKSRGVIDTDDRIVDFGKNGVIKIIRNDGCTGTGFVVDAHTIATAAHCVATKPDKNATYYNTASISKILIFKPDGTIEQTITNPKQYHIPNNFASTPGTTNRYDYALITVEQDLSAYANFNLGIMLDSFQAKHKLISVTGFPGEVNGQTVNDGDNHVMYTGNGYVVDNKYDADLQFCYDCDVSGGNSGGPVYISSAYDGKAYYTVIGIVTAEHVERNIATRITTDLLHFYKNNPNITY